MFGRHTHNSSSTPHLLREPVFRAWWSARLCAQTAQAALLYGLLILITDRTDRGIYAALFVVCSIVPTLAFGLFGGWLADRLPQRAVLIVLNLARAGLVALLLGSVVSLTTIFVVTLGIWIIQQFFSPTETATIARIVPVEDLDRANALAHLAFTLAQVAGMVLLAPLLLKLPDERILFMTVAALYALAAVFLVRMGRLPGRDPGDTRALPLDLRRGWRIVVADRPAFGALLDAILISVGMSALVVLVPYYLVDVLHTDAGNTVFVFAPAVVGVLLGLQVAAVLGRWIGYTRLAFLGLLGFAICVALLGLIDPFIEMLNESEVELESLENQLGLSRRTSATMLLSIPAGFCSAVTSVATRTVLLARAPEEARGQILATQSTISDAVALLPTLAAGLALDLVDVRVVAFTIALLLVIGAIAGRRIGADHRTSAAAAVGVQTAVSATATPASRHET